MSRWNEFLTGRGYDAGDATPDMSAAATGGDVIADLSHVTAIRIAGPDATRFLQNQLTNDLAALPDPGAQPSGYCNPQGRLVAVLDLLRLGDAYTALCASDVATPLEERLVKYRLRARVDIGAGGGDGVLAGVSGSRVIEAITPLVGPVDATPYAVTPFESGWTLGMPGDRPRVALFAPASAMEGVWARATTVATPVGRGAWELLDVRQGLPVVRESTMEAFVPQMVNLERVGGVSFTKGCFPGQEIVARLHYRGALKRRMALAHVDTEYIVPPGTPIVSTGTTKVGQVVRSAPAEDGGCELLAVLNLDAMEGPLHVADADGARLAIRSLPYSVAETSP